MICDTCKKMNLYDVSCFVVPSKKDGLIGNIKVSISPLLGVHMLNIGVACYGLWHLCLAGNWQG